MSTDTETKTESTIDLSPGKYTGTLTIMGMSTLPSPYPSDVTDKLQIFIIDGGKAPQRADTYSIGYDIYSNEDTKIEPWTRKAVKSGFSCILPAGTYGRVAPRSGLAMNGIDVAGGVIDINYRKEVGVILVNNSDKPFEVKKHERIAQFICERAITPEVIILSKIEDTGRGGFGSTGKT